VNWILEQGNEGKIERKSNGKARKRMLAYTG
jgi:hypothetical protein